MTKIQSKEIGQFVNKNLSPRFFKENIVDEKSAYSILDFSLNLFPANEEMKKALELTLNVNKETWEAEISLIEQEKDIDKLYNLLRKPMNPIATEKLILKLMENKDSIIPRLLEDLKRSGNDIFIENGARIMVAYGKEYSDRLAEIINKIKYPYCEAVMAFVLGRIGSEEHIGIIFDSYKRLMTNRFDNYYQGPLLGLYHMKNKYEF